MIERVAPAAGRAGAIDALEVSAFVVPTDAPEADGTFRWSSTTIVVVRVRAAGAEGLGYTYADTATATLIRDLLAGVVIGRDAFSVRGAWDAMARAVRNLGRPGIASMAMAAVDVALWDLKAKLLDLPLVDLIGRVRDAVPAYGSGGFTSYSVAELEQQLGGWIAGGLTRVKMKVGRDRVADRERVRAARDVIGPDAELFADANGAWTRAEALAEAEALAAWNVSWLEEPVSSDDLDGLRLLCDRAPAGMAIAAGEYGYTLPDFRRLLEARAVHVLQADATRCAGITGFLQVAAVCEAWATPLSAHTAPALHTPLGCALASVAHVEYFHDHARIEQMLFDGAPRPMEGVLRPDAGRAGLGLTLKDADAERYAV